MSEEPTTPSFCGERERLDQELRTLLMSKSAIREQITGEIFANPAERRAKLVQLNEMIDNAIVVMNVHHKHCSCERTGSVAQSSFQVQVPVIGEANRVSH